MPSCEEWVVGDLELVVYTLIQHEYDRAFDVGCRCEEILVLLEEAISHFDLGCADPLGINRLVPDLGAR